MPDDELDIHMSTSRAGATHGVVTVRFGGDFIIEKCDLSKTKDRIQLNSLISQKWDTFLDPEKNKQLTLYLEERAKELASSVMEPVVTCMSDVTEEELFPIWDQRIYEGLGTLLIGMPGAGKTTVLNSIIASITGGVPWPHGQGTYEAGDVLLLNVEDHKAKVLAKRLRVSGADLSRVHVLDRVRPQGGKGKSPGRPITMHDVDAFEQCLKKYRPKLAAIDPISAMLPKVEGNSNNEMRAIMVPIIDACERYNAGLVIVNHMSKSGSGSAMLRSLGSIALPAAARCVLFVSEEDGQAPDRMRYLSCPKSNVAPLAPTLGFRIVDGRCVWESEAVDMTADECLAAMTPAETGSKKPDAKKFLADYLADGPKPTLEVEHAAEGLKIGQRTLDRARKSLGVTSYRDPPGKGPWFIQLPPETDRHSGTLSPSNTPNQSATVTESHSDNNNSNGFLDRYTYPGNGHRSDDDCDDAEGPET